METLTVEQHYQQLVDEEATRPIEQRVVRTYKASKHSVIIEENDCRK